MKKINRMCAAAMMGLLYTGGVMADEKKEVTLPEELVESGAKVEQVVGGMGFCEGPVWMEGKLVFSDIPNKVIHSWTKKEGVGVVRQAEDETNGNTVDLEGRLITCERDGRRVTRRQRDDTLVTLAGSYRGKKLNNPNDVVVKSDGTIWFTDPTYGIQKEQKEQDHNYVFRLDPRTFQLEAVAADFDQPNGICFSPDEKKLYVADSGKGHHIRVFDVGVGNRLSEGKVFAVVDQGVPDGIRCDEGGRVWSSAGDGVQVFDTEGKLLGRILVKESPANVCFGGEDGKTLFMTARTSVYAIPVKVSGAGKAK